LRDLTVPDLELTPVFLLLADISGYTRFVTLHGASVLHAEEIITKLMEAVLDAAAEPLVLNKLEGDAAFLYAPAGEQARQVGEQLVRQVLGFFAAFKAEQQALIKAGEGGCTCDACCNIGELKLKTILHSGSVVMKKVRQLAELAGGDVIVAHRLLKSSLAAKEYLMVTEKFYEMGGGVPDQEPEHHTDTFEEIGDIKTLVYYPATAPLTLPATRPLTRPGGIARGLALFFRPLWRRLTRQRQTFHNLPG
jgi:class 3 adenylate cyclase